MPAVLDTAERREVARALTGPPTRCPNPDCGGPVSWELGVRASHHAPGHGQLRLSDAVPRLVLVCEEEAEPLWVLEDDGELGAYLDSLRPVQVVVIGRRGGRRRANALLRWIGSVDD